MDGRSSIVTRVYGDTFIANSTWLVVATVVVYDYGLTIEHEIRYLGIFKVIVDISVHFSANVTNTNPYLAPRALTQLPPHIQCLSKAGIGYPRSNHHARPHDSANLLALHAPLLFLHLKAEYGSRLRLRDDFKNISAKNSCASFCFVIENFSWTLPVRDLNMVGLMGSWSTGSGVEPRPHQNFDEGRDTGGVRLEMAARDMGSSSVQEQGRVIKDQEWHVRKAGSVNIDADAM
ncbi:hypothetical protein BU17DRAFT_60093 [Hysterangium stoloniferum]|nr:hypothetical protein BU17DRAFT_60093 [Hysterangium stoloniferum]